jgi:hypothetical protein
MVDELALGNPHNWKEGKRFHGKCHKCGKKEHKSVNCKAPKKEKGDKTTPNTQGSRNKKHCDFCGLVWHI